MNTWKLPATAGGCALGLLLMFPATPASAQNWAVDPGYNNRIIYQTQSGRRNRSNNNYHYSNPKYWYDNYYDYYNGSGYGNYYNPWNGYYPGYGSGGYYPGYPNYGGGGQIGIQPRYYPGYGWVYF